MPENTKSTPPKAMPPSDEELELWWFRRIKSPLHENATLEDLRLVRETTRLESPDALIRCFMHFSGECDEVATHAFADSDPFLPAGVVSELFDAYDKTPMVCARHADSDDLEVGTMTRAVGRAIFYAMIREVWEIEHLPAMVAVRPFS